MPLRTPLNRCPVQKWSLIIIFAYLPPIPWYYFKQAAIYLILNWNSFFFKHKNLIVSWVVKLLQLYVFYLNIFRSTCLNFLNFFKLYFYWTLPPKFSSTASTLIWLIKTSLPHRSTLNSFYLANFIRNPTWFLNSIYI